MWLITVCNSSSGEPDALLWLLQASGTCMVHRDTSGHKSINVNDDGDDDDDNVDDDDDDI